MATITNLTNRRLTVTGKDSTSTMVSVGFAPRLDRFGKISPESSREVDDALAQSWEKRASVQHELRRGAYTLEYSRAETLPGKVQVIRPEEPITDGETQDVTKLHHKTLVAQIPEMTDLDELELLAADPRQSVSEAAYKRMEELEE